MAAKLMVQLVQARNLAAKDSNGLSDPFVRLQLGKTKARSATVYKSLDPTWNEEFLFNVRELEVDVLHITLWDEDMLGQADFLGQITLPVMVVAQAEGMRIPPTWFVLKKKSEKSRVFVSGEVVQKHTFRLLNVKLRARAISTSNGHVPLLRIVCLHGAYTARTRGGAPPSEGRLAQGRSPVPSQCSNAWLKLHCNTLAQLSRIAVTTSSSSPRPPSRSSSLSLPVSPSLPLLHPPFLPPFSLAPSLNPSIPLSVHQLLPHSRLSLFL